MSSVFFGVEGLIRKEPVGIRSGNLRPHIRRAKDEESGDYYEVTLLQENRRKNKLIAKL